MPTALIVNGRISWSGNPRVVITAVPHQPMLPREAEERSVREEQRVPALFRGPEGVVRDEHDGLSYRLVDRIDPQQGWATCESLMRWFGVDHRVVVAWAQKGLLDCASERSSSVRYYRVLNPEALKADMPKRKPGRPRKGGR